MSHSILSFLYTYMDCRTSNANRPTPNGNCQLSIVNCQLSIETGYPIFPVR